MATKRRKRKRGDVPQMHRHSTGQARVVLCGRTFYCGRFGTAAAGKRYAELVEQWERNGRKPLQPAPDVEQVRPLRSVFATWESYLDASGRYVKAGKPTSQRAIVALAVREFVERFGDVPASSYSERHLLQHRDELERRPRLSRGGINRKVGILVAGLRWAYGRGFITRDGWLGTSAVEPLTRAEAGNRDRKRTKRAVSLDEVERVAACLPRVPAAMLRLQAILGCRPGEVCGMRWCDIDRTPIVVDGITCWTYHVDGAKAEHHGKATSYAVPPRAQAILERFPPTAPAAPIFSPASTMAELHELRRAQRQTPETKQMHERDAGPGREFADRYDVPTYRQAIERGIRKSGVQPFSPHEVRHGAVTRAAARFGAFAASVFANHANVSTTEGYVHAPAIERYRVAVGLETVSSGTAAAQPGTAPAADCARVTAAG
jgi:integrase